MFTISYISPLGECQHSTEFLTREQALEGIKGALEQLETLPAGAKLEILYEENSEEEIARVSADK